MAKRSSYDIVMENRKALVDSIIENMKKGYIVPRTEWNKNCFRPNNPISNIAYRGGNRLKLMITADAKGYKDNRWMTYKQAKENGYQIKKGEKGVMCEKWIFSKKAEIENPITGIKEKVNVKLDKPIANYFVVFNAEQIDNIPSQEITHLEHDEVLQMADDFIASSDCPIYEKDQGRAYYSTAKDCIILPPRNIFISQEAFLGTMLHEMVHSTGHKDRLNRDMEGSFGDSTYAMEELRAELGSFFIESDLNINIGDEHFNSHTEYLESWIGALKKDPNELFKACRDADAASSRLINNYEKYLGKNSTNEEMNNINEGVAMEIANQTAIPTQEPILEI